ncbi:adenylate and guanylate cyclase catalytic domain-containing protein [Mycolicibacterium madagascariense]|uniref:Adenylate and guanylate cyclase catalytic domain-containing protein n=1 Tax=Mycolicibacterium madagascariense TaxID=212765 RepID=A0A7I7XIE3_9MYCO|nr:adenylate and guanylate cyclase catalytic domain-containing protein [Mycolicibacterium madagascariense]
MDVESFGERSAHQQNAGASTGGPLSWLKQTNRNPGLVAFVRRARRALPGDPDFGDPLSAAGVGGPRAAARAADRILDRYAASREVSLAGLQLWQALTERVSGQPANPEVTLVFTDLVGFSEWSLRAGDDAVLKLLRRVTQVTEPPLLHAGGRIVKRMGDGAMVVFTDPATAVGAVLAALDAVKTVQVGGYTPLMRAGIHTGRPQRIGSDWLGVDVNVAARVMDRATRGGLVVSNTTLNGIGEEDFAALDISVKRVRKQLFSAKTPGVPDDLTMYWVRSRGTLPDDGAPDAAPEA